MRIFEKSLRKAMLGVALVAGIPLAACNGHDAQTDSAVALPALPATLPLAPGYAGEPTYAPAVAALPDAPRLPMARVADPRDTYAYADDAWGFDDALGEAPPDYGFYYDDVEPWAWEGYDQSLAFVEPLDDGYRYYYYRPGDDEPYFIRDPDWGYGYDNGRLAVVYGPDWQVVPYADYGPRLAYGSRYYARGRELYRASHQRHPVIVGNWIERRQAVAGEHMAWAQERQRVEPWQDYHARAAVRQERHWNQERARRRADEVRFASWREQNFRTPPPPRAIPAAWQGAKWAQDERRFAPPTKGFAGDIRAQRRAADAERNRFADPSARIASRRDVAQQAGARDAQLAARTNDRAARREQLIAERQAVQALPAQDRREARMAEREQLRVQREARVLPQAAQQRRPDVEVRQQQRLAERQQAQALRQQANAARDARRAEPARAQQLARQQDGIRQQAEQRRAERAQVNVQAQQRRAEAEQRRASAAQARAQADQGRQQAEQRRQAAQQARAERVQRQQAQRQPAQAAAPQQAREARRAEVQQAQQARQAQRQQAQQARQAAQQAEQGRQAQRQVAQQAQQARQAQRQEAQQARAEQRPQVQQQREDRAAARAARQEARRGPGR